MVAPMRTAINRVVTSRLAAHHLLDGRTDDAATPRLARRFPPAAPDCPRFQLVGQVQWG